MRANSVPGGTIREGALFFQTVAAAGALFKRGHCSRGGTIRASTVYTYQILVSSIHISNTSIIYVWLVFVMHGGAHMTEYSSVCTGSSAYPWWRMSWVLALSIIWWWVICWSLMHTSDLLAGLVGMPNSQMSNTRASLIDITVHLSDWPGRTLPSDSANLERMHNGFDMCAVHKAGLFVIGLNDSQHTLPFVNFNKLNFGWHVFAGLGFWLKNSKNC